ncbi:GNAT family N-acetyltransferase [Sporosarcina sp. FSL W8-0480]|uniref:GNAT family N-acetyltransferase n=1 Tax=Sporosarcina sp. FSL W8-0480 TaxID=2954701 RepID=UPI0030D82EC8
MENLICFRALKIDDFDSVLKWSLDNAFCLANGWEVDRSEDELYSWWLRCVNNESADFVRLGVQLKDKLIGYVDLADIKNNRAELGIAIGESQLWGRGIGTSTILSFMQYASEKYGITTFDAETHEGNSRSKKMLEKIGFVEISRVGIEEYLGIDNQLIQYCFDFYAQVP